SRAAAWSRLGPCAAAQPPPRQPTQRRARSRAVLAPYNNDNGRPTVHKDVARLAVLLACVALATSRFGLVAHELVGHGGAALALGGDVIGVKLFWFAGGWIRYRGITGDEAALAVAMAGIAVELACGVALWCLLGGDTLGRRILRAVAAALVVHGGWYLATGAWHGY